MRRKLQTVGVLALLAVASISLFIACNGDNDTSPAPDIDTSQATATPFVFPDVPFVGTRDKIEEDPKSIFDRAPILELVNTFDGGPFDRMEFTFDAGLPPYSIEYVEGPITACGSGLPVEIAGTRFLQIRMEGAAAHNDLGEVTVTNADQVLDYPTLLQLTMICDFEGEVVWIAGLSEEVNFKTLFLTTPFPHIIIIDVNHPGRD